jgi:hypothetical protein
VHLVTPPSQWSSLARNQIITINRPPYSPDLAPCDFWLLHRLASEFKGHHFTSVNKMEENISSHSHWRSGPAEGLPAIAGPLEQMLMCWRAELRGLICYFLHITLTESKPEFWEMFDPPMYIIRIFLYSHSYILKFCNLFQLKVQNSSPTNFTVTE